MFDVAVDTARNVAYVYYVTGGVAHIAVFGGASGLTGSLTLTQTIDFAAGTFPLSTAAVGIFLDIASDRLYVPNVSGGTATVEVFTAPHNASGLAGGSSAPSRTITLPGVTSYTNVFVELTANRLYAADPAGTSIAQGASTITTTLGGVRVIAPLGSTFTAVAVKP